MICAAGAWHIACGQWCGQANVPQPEEGSWYTQISCGDDHTVFLQNDDPVISCGMDKQGQCAIPRLLAEGLKHTGIAVEAFHTVLLRSNGTAFAIESNECRQYNVPLSPRAFSAIADLAVQIMPCAAAPTPFVICTVFAGMLELFIGKTPI